MMISRRYRRIITVWISCATILFVTHHFYPGLIGDTELPRPQINEYTPIGDEIPLTEEKELVVASMAGDDVSWLEEFFDTWKRNVYIVNNASAPLTVPINKGREAMPFLTYIITRYNTLPDVSIFIHSLRYQWHNEDPMYDGLPVLKRLRLSHVKSRGFVALRCSWTMGCPAELHPLHPSTKSDDRSQNERAYAAAFRHFFPEDEVPEVVGAHCSSQFAVSRSRIRARPQEFYQQVRKWVLDTELGDQISGRVMEYMWHIIFGMPAVDCQEAGECFCQTFGLCNLKCDGKECEKRYILPQYANIPSGWPEVGPGANGWPAIGWAD
jgi:hypothetical protein